MISSPGSLRIGDERRGLTIRTITEVYARVPPQYLTAVIKVRTVCQLYSPLQMRGIPAGEIGLTRHDQQSGLSIGRSKLPEKWQGKVRRDVEETPKAEHLQMRELAKRRTEARVEVELVEKLADAHDRDQEGETGWVEADSSRAVWPEGQLKSLMPYDATHVVRKDKKT